MTRAVSLPTHLLVHELYVAAIFAQTRLCVCLSLWIFLVIVTVYVLRAVMRVRLLVCANTLANKIDSDSDSN